MYVCMHSFPHLRRLVNIKSPQIVVYFLVVQINAPYHQWLCNDIAHIDCHWKWVEMSNNSRDIVCIFIVESTLLGNMNFVNLKKEQ